MLPVHRTKLSIFNYDEIPPGYYYKAMHQGSSVQRFWHLKKFEVVANLVPNHARVLDIGCGPGSFLEVLAMRKPSVSAIGIDVASKQINFAEAQVGSQFGGRIKFETLKSVKPFCLPYPDNSFDAVTCIEVIEHLHPFIASQILAEASRVLKKDSLFILTTPNYRSLWPLLEVVLERLSPVKYHEQHISKFTPNSFVKFVESCGLEVKKLSSIFYCAPFVSGISTTLANFLFAQENRLPIKLGNLLVLQARKINWADYE